MVAYFQYKYFLLDYLWQWGHVTSIKRYKAYYNCKFKANKALDLLRSFVSKKLFLKIQEVVTLNEALDIIFGVIENEELEKSFIMPNVFYDFKNEKEEEEEENIKTKIRGINLLTKNNRYKMRIQIFKNWGRVTQ